MLRYQIVCNLLLFEFVLLLSIYFKNIYALFWYMCIFSNYTAPKLKKDLTETEKKQDKECYIDITEPRENLTERLKREFGFDDESEGMCFLNYLPHLVTSLVSFKSMLSI